VVHVGDLPPYALAVLTAYVNREPADFDHLEVPAGKQIRPDVYEQLDQFFGYLARVNQAIVR